MIQVGLYIFDFILILVIASAVSYGVGKADGIAQQKEDQDSP